MPQGQLSGLTFFSVSDNSLIGSIPAYMTRYNLFLIFHDIIDLNRFPNLTTIRFYNNRLTGDIPDLSSLGSQLQQCLLGPQNGTSTKLQCPYPLPPLCYTEDLCAIPPAQQQSLVALAAFTSLNWGGAPDCSWTGIGKYFSEISRRKFDEKLGCDKQGRITTITINGIILNGALPSSIGSIYTLTQLNAAGCNITGYLPSSLGTLTNLTVL